MNTSINEEVRIENNQRRQLLKGATVVAASLALGATAAHASEHDHAHMHHGANKNQEIIDATFQCLKDGEACLDHCIVLLKEGDMSMAGCTDTVTEMLAMCGAMSKMASYDSKHLAKLASVCVATCQACEKECSKHEKIHATCHACAESCRACIKACKKIAA